MAEQARTLGPGTAQAGRRGIPVPFLFPVGVAAVGVFVFGHGLGTLPLWRDEAASVAIASRPVGGILAAAGRIDVVHTAYYLLLHPLLLLGDGEALLRLPSLVGVVVAVVLTAELARRLFGVGPAVVTAALLVGNPWLAFYAREARPYALATALVCAAAFVLLGGPPTRRRLAVFACLGVLATWLHLFDLLPVLGLLTARAFLARRAVRERPAMWVVSAAVLVAAAAPLALVAAAEARQVSWIGTPTMADVETLLHDVTGSAVAAFAVAALLGVAALLSVAGAPRWLAHTVAGPHTLREVCVDPGRCVSAGAVLVAALVGAFAGPVVLLGVSRAGQPLYVERYVLASVPLLALAAGAAVRMALGPAEDQGLAAPAGAGRGRAFREPAVWRWQRGVGAVLAGLVFMAALTGAPAAFAGPPDKTEDLRAAAAHLAAAARPADCVAYDPSWARIGLDFYLAHAQPNTAATLRDVALDPGPAGQHPVGLFPAELPLAVVEANLDACTRVWVAGYPGPVGKWRPVPEVTGTALVAVADRFTVDTPADFGDFRLTLWTAR